MIVTFIAILVFAFTGSNMTPQRPRVSHEDLTALGDVLCAEGGYWIGTPKGERELAVIGQVAINHIDFYQQPLRKGLAVPRRWAHKPISRCPGQLRIFTKKVLRGEHDLPPWAYRAVAFATKSASRRVEKRWRQNGYVPIEGTDTEHVFWEKRNSKF